MSGIRHKYNTRAAAKERSESMHEEDLQSSQEVEDTFDISDGSTQGLSSTDSSHQENQKNSDSHLSSIDTNAQSSYDRDYEDTYHSFAGSNNNNQESFNFYNNNEQENQKFDFIS